MERLAMATCAVLREPYGDPRTDAFDELTPIVFAAAESHPSFIARAGEADDREDLSDVDRDWGPWGPHTLPTGYFTDHFQGPYRAAQTLSLWTDLDGLRNFIYSGPHQQGLLRRHEWFIRPAWPTYALWWLSGERMPTWAESAEKLDLIARLGPTPQAFDLRTPFVPASV